VTIRKGDVQDVPFLRDMLVHAFYWRADDAFEAEDPLSRYVKGWGRRGDLALVAQEGMNRVGAAWMRLFSADHPGLGFVDERTPELAIAVVPARRGHGTGAALLEALMDRARKEGFETISLSVEVASPAVSLYERHGFEKVGENGDSWTMLARL
jgi:ribosomal protein S18 acetylase RimI-like enzyme